MKLTKQHSHFGFSSPRRALPPFPFFLFPFFLFPLSFSGQTLRQTILGGPGHESTTSITGGTDDGSVFAAGTTNSSTTNEQFAWVARIDSMGEVMWQRQVSLGSGFTARAEIAAGGDPLELVLAATVYNGLPAAYDLHWWTLDPATGEMLGNWPAVVDGWQVLSEAIVLPNQTTWTAFQDYSDAPATAKIRRLNLSNGLSWSGEWTVAEEEWWSDLTVHPSTGMVAGLTAFDEVDGLEGGRLRLWTAGGAEVWSVALPFDSTEWVGCSVSEDAEVIALGTRTTVEGGRQVVARYDAEGTLTLAMQIGGQNDVQAQAVGWLNGTDFVTFPFGESFGFGGGESAVMVWNDFGNWQGGVSVGTPARDEAMAIWVEPETGVVWGAGRTNGFSADGDWDAWVFRSSENPMFDPVEETVLWQAGDWAMTVAGAPQKPGLTVVPNVWQAGELTSVQIEGCAATEVVRLVDALGQTVHAAPLTGFREVVAGGAGVYVLACGSSSTRIVIQ